MLRIMLQVGMEVASSPPEWSPPQVISVGVTSHNKGLKITPFHVAMIFAALILCILLFLVPWDSMKCLFKGSEQPRPTESEEEGVSSAATPEQGLPKQVVRTFKVVRFGSSTHSAGADLGTECMICLSDFRRGQRLRIVPDCNHGFHIKCIDKWLASHTSCPICRHKPVQNEKCQQFEVDQC